MTPRVRKPSHRILVVEDEPPVLARLKEQLTKAGYRIVTAMDGNQALRYISDETFDLILLDLVMPNKNGYEVLLELKAKRYPTPVIVASSLGHKDDMAYALQLGAQEYFLKATHFPNIVSHIDRVLKKNKSPKKRS